MTMTSPACPLADHLKGLITSAIRSTSRTSWTSTSPSSGVRALGVGLSALTWWLARHDVARRYDATLHAVFIGFVISMVFAHAPVIVPSVLGLPLEYRPAFYLHVGVLHISLIVRVVGDLVDRLGRWRVWGGLLNAAALLLFMFNTGRSMALRGNHGDSI